MQYLYYYHYYSRGLRQSLGNALFVLLPLLIKRIKAVFSRCKNAPLTWTLCTRYALHSVNQRIETTRVKHEEEADKEILTKEENEI